MRFLRPFLLPKPAAAYLPVIAGVGLFLALQFGLGLWRLTRVSGGMGNQFKNLAREEYLGFLVLQNLHVLAGCVLLAVVGAWLLRPFASVWTAAARRKGRAWLVARSFVLAFALHGFFVLRLVDTRPYFLKDIDFGHWYYRILEVVPDAARPTFHLVLFTVTPLLLLAWVFFWHFRSGRAGAVVAGGLAAGLLVAGLFTLRSPAFAAAPATGEGDTPWNVIIIGSDSLRGDRIGANGYRPARSDGAAAAGVSPGIDALAARSANFRLCYAPMASTLESGMSLMASQYPQTHGIRQMFPDRATLEAAAAAIEPVAPLLAQRGYDTAALGDWCAGYYDLVPLGFGEVLVSSYDNFKIYMSQAVLMAHSVIPLYFDHPPGYRMFPQIRSFAQFVTPEVVTRRVENRLARRAADGRPFFWHVFYSCNHLPFRSPEPYRSLFSDPAYNGPHRSAVDFDIDAFIGGTDLDAKSEALSEADVAQIRALYDGATRMFDDQVQRVLDAVERHGLADRTIIVITSDHGEDLYEPGVTLGHGQTMNGGLQSYHIPLVVHVPGMPPADFPEMVRMIDLIPSLAELLGVAPAASWEGRSFAAWLDGSAPPEWRPFYGETGFPFIQFAVEGVEHRPLPPMDAMTFIDRTFNFQFVLKEEFRERVIEAKQRCLRTRHWKLVLTPAADGTRHYALFNLTRDPQGETDLAAARPEVLAPMIAALERWVDHHEESTIHAIFPDGEPE